MKAFITTLFVLAVVLWIPDTSVVQAQSAGASSTAWPEVTRDSKPWTRWWWLGSAVDKPTITKLLESYQKAGLGGVEITPIYGIRGEENRFIDFLSPEWMDMLAHVVAEGNRLDMGIDMATGTGWPFGGPQIDPDHAASRVIIETYTVAEGERLTDPVVHRDRNLDRPAELQALVAVSEDGRMEDLTEHVNPDGRLDWTASEGALKLYALFRAWTGQMVKRAAPGAEGLVMNHYDRAALDLYLKRFDAAFAAHPNLRVNAFFNDSYEAYGADWTPDLLAEFEQRRGYDLRSELPALAGDGPEEIAARVKSDYRETISDLILENFTEPWTAWAHDKGSPTRNQAHGSPGNILDLYAAVDIPETETFGPAGNPDNDPLVGKFASSAANVTGKRLSSSESATWLREHFTVTLEDLKNIVDQVFVTGINHLFYHGTVYSPTDETWPGWLFYASTQVNPANPIWRDLPIVNEYVARVQSILQSGAPDNDVLLYWPVYDNWHDSTGLLMNFPVHAPDWFYGKPFGQVAEALWRTGHAFDYVSDRQLAGANTGADGRVLTTRGKSEARGYRVVLVPSTGHMPLETLEKLVELARNGATVLFEKALPADVPGLFRLVERRERLVALKSRLQVAPYGVNGFQEAPIGRGRFVIGDDVLQLLEEAGVERERMVDHNGVQFVRRWRAGGYDYFVRNAGHSALDGWVELSVAAGAVEIMDPMSRKTGLARRRTNPAGRAEIFLQLQSGGSVILRTFDTAVSLSPWRYAVAEGRPIPVEGSWTLEFLEGGPVLPAARNLDAPVDFATLDDADAQRFAGTARYTVRFDLPVDALNGEFQPESSYLLDLGDVWQSARVRLNGRDLGVLVMHPFQIETERLKRTENVLEIEVTNLAANRIRDLDRRGVLWRRFYDINLVNIDYRQFDASQWSLRPSGLAGPVRLFRIRQE